MSPGRTSFLCSLFAALAGSVAGTVQIFPSSGGWSDVSIRRGGGWTWVETADGSHVAHFCAVPNSDALTPLIVASNTASALHLDVRPAFAAGATGVSIYLSDLDLSEISGNDSVTALVDWEGPCGMEMRNLLIGDRTDGKGWNEGASFTSGYCRRRTSEHTFNVPTMKNVFHRIDVLSAGEGGGVPGEFRLYGIRTGSFAELGTDRPVRSSAPRLLFHASFDRDAMADFACGEAAPVRAEGIAFVPGRKGRGVRFESGKSSVLSWKCRGNIDPRQGTVAFWLKREWTAADRWRAMFFCPGADRRGGGALNFWNLNDQIRLDRHDLDNWHDSILSDWIPPVGNDWCHYIFTWDGQATRLYMNGRAVPGWADETKADDYSPSRAALKDVVIHAFNRPKGSFSRFYLGSQDGRYPQDGIFDELKVYSQAMTSREAFELAKDEGAKVTEDPVAVPIAANAYVSAAREKVGTPAGLKLVDRVRPAVDVLAPDRFAKVGEVAKKTLNGVDYLEAGARQDDRFAVRFSVDPKKPLHCFEVDYPDDAKRTAEFLVQRTRRPVNDYTLQSGVFCGDEYPTSGRIRTERYVYWTSDADVTFIATTLRENAPAAVSEIRLYEVTDASLPAAIADAAPSSRSETPLRSFANYWEDPAFFADFGTDGTSAAAISDQIDRFAAYLKFCGQDTLFFPACFYGGRIGENGYNPRPLPCGYLESVCSKFDREGLSFVPTINQQVVPLASNFVTRASMSDGSLHPTEIAILSTGKPNWGGWHGTPPNFNVAHPNVQAEFRRLVRELATEGRPHPSFKGVALHLAQVNPLWWGSIACGYNDYNIDAFTKATGVRVPIGRTDRLRGREYAKWISANAREKWIAWRCQVVADFYRSLADELRTIRADLRLWVVALPDSTLTDFREAGFDPAVLKTVEGLVVGGTGYPAELRRFPGEKMTSTDFTRDYGWAHFHDMYWENAVGARRTGREVLSNDWLDETRWRVSALHPCGENALRPYAEALAKADVKAFSCGGFLIGTLGMEPELAAFMREFRKLPAVDFTDAPSPDGWVVRRARIADCNWEYRVQTVAPYRLEVLAEKMK